MEYIKWFKELSKESLGVAGGKGANLAEMANLGLPVPAGFVITAQTYQEFIEKTKIKKGIFGLLEGLNVEETEKLQKTAGQIQNLIIKTGVPEEIAEVIKESYEVLGAEKGKAEKLLEGQEVFVAVRSSATAEDMPGFSFAGQMATFLNVKGEEELIKAVRACWASLFTARAIYYREKNNFPHEKVLIAVVIQKMVNSAKCLHPNTFIQAGNGEILAIKDQVEQKNLGNLISADLPHFKIENSKCIRFNRIQSPKWLYKIITRTGQIVSTGEHGFFILDGFQMKEKKTKQLCFGERIAAVKKIEVEGYPYKFPSLFKYYIISEEGLDQLYRKRKGKSTLKEISALLKINFSSIRGLEKGLCRISEDKLEKLCDHLEINFNDFIKKYGRPSFQKTHKSSILIPEQTSPELCQVLGYVLGDANIRGKSTLILTDGDEKNLQIYKGLIKKVFNIDGLIRIDGKRQRLLVQSYELVRFLRKNCFSMLTKSPSRTIPPFIHSLPHNQLAAFIRGLFEGEGCVKNSLKITMSSKKVIFVLKNLLLRFGIIGHVKEVKNRQGFGKGRTYFLLEVCGQEDITSFYKNIGFSSPAKKRNLEILIKKLKEHRKYSLTETFPINKKLLREIIAKLGFKNEMRDFQCYLYRHNLSFPVLEKIYEKLNRRFLEISQLKINKNNFWEARRKLKVAREELCSTLCCSEKTLEKVEKCKSKKSKVKKEEIVRLLKEKQQTRLTYARPHLINLKNILNKNIFFDEIKEIKKIPTDVDWLYDLTINPHSNYLANGFITHNSGVMFTINPSTNNPEEIVIEAVYGLGEAIVSGEVNPDLYIVDKKERSIKKIEVKKQEWGLFRNEKGENEKRKIKESLQERQICDEKEIKELARLGKKIEEHYGIPQDIEWAIEKGEIFIVQSRAVTTFKPAEEEKKGERPGIKEEAGKILLRGEMASRGVYSGKVKIVRNTSELGKIQKGDVLVTVMTTPDMVPAMQKAGAIVTDAGGLTCHAAIVSREMGTPCLVGTEQATQVLKEGEMVTVHASRGLVYEGKIEIGEERKETLKGQVAEGRPLTATEIKVIMDLPEKAAEVAGRYQPDGVGLVRLEFIIAEGGIHPAEYIRQNRDEEYTELLVKGLRRIGLAFKGKPVWVRNSDIRTDEYRNLKGGEKERQETDPMLGWHGIRRLLDEPRILKAEFLAIKKLQEEGLKNMGIMLPFVIRREEVKKAKEILREAGLEPGKEVEFGVMVETPAACWIIEELCREGINFISLGTNDLTQLTLGIDRNNERIAGLFDETHPAVLEEIAKVIKVCKRYKVKTSICGQAGSKREMVEFLVHQGIDSISVNVDAIEEIRKVVAETERKLLKEGEKK